MMLLRMTAGVLSQNISIFNLMYYRTGLCLGLIFHNDVFFRGGMHCLSPVALFSLFTSWIVYVAADLS